MRLTRLTIHALPGIEPGFTFEPPSDQINFVTGPNAIGKSSLARALKYLLGGVDRQRDPPSLHLEAEFLSGDIRWTVHRTGGQIAWMRDGESATPPPLPGADQFGLYRLSVESLLADDKSDQALADALWRTLRGGFDLDGARGHIGARFGRTEERKLQAERKTFGGVKRKYEALQDEEEKLPSLVSRIEEADQAIVRRKHLETALELDAAIRKRQECGAALDGFPARMDKLHGDELERIDDLDRKVAGLREQRSDAQRRLAAASQDLELTGLRDARPDPEDVSQIQASLQRVLENAIKRENAQEAVVRTKADLSDALTQFEGGAEPPRLDANSLERARKIIEPLGDWRVRRRELQQRLELAGACPDDTEIEQLRDAASALRAWLAAQAGGGSEDGEVRAGMVHRSVVVALALAAITTVAAFLAGAWWASASALATAAALFASLYFARHGEYRAATSTANARRMFAETGLTSPGAWKVPAVREHLRRNVESPLDQLRLQKERAAGAENLRAELREVNSTVEGLETKENALAKEIGINPALSGAPFLRFIAVTERWDEARAGHAAKEASLQALNALIVKDAARIRAFLDHWRSADAPPLTASSPVSDIDSLRTAFHALDERLSVASKAEGVIASEQDKVNSLEDRIQEVRAERSSLFARAALEAGARDDLASLIDRLDAWRQARRALAEAETEEKRIRALLADEADLIEAVERRAIDGLERELQIAERDSDARDTLIEEQTRINTRIGEARKNHELEDAASRLDEAAEALRDKRDQSLFHGATEVLLDDVENAFKTEREPDLLRKARERFEQVTAHAFTLELRGKETFAARDLKQDKLRSPTELSSGTRMQLLLALRLAWTEDRERGGESLPVFLDEALTTSDENRFSVMARTLSRLAETEGRQIFYLSARRHEAALWERATGTAPPVIDLAAVRFRAAPSASASLHIEMPPPLPPPNGLDAATYATRIGVPPLNPRGSAGGIHLFHLLRDDLLLLHRLMDTWYISTAGQLESLLASDAARSAVSERQTRQRLLLRSKTARSWTGLWRQGRGRPVDRVVLDQCPAVSNTFLDRAADLARELRGDGRALVQALREGLVKGFQTRKINDLADWLADEGYIGDAVKLEPEERRRLTLQRVVSGTQADAHDVNQVVEWMESAVAS